ncbi:MAG: hypothetical protein V2A79_02635 [Planctomycetota bacterium]
MATRISTESELDALLARMNAEAWADVGILTSQEYRSWRVEHLRKSGWSAGHIVVLNREFVRPALWGRIPSSVRVLAAPECAFGEAGARAIAEHLPGLTSLNLTVNLIGDDGARRVAATSSPSTGAGGCSPECSSPKANGTREREAKCPCRRGGNLKLKPMGMRAGYIGQWDSASTQRGFGRRPELAGKRGQRLQGAQGRAARRA